MAEYSLGLNAAELRQGLCRPLELPAAIDRGVSVSVCRLDLLHPHYGGNKYFKLAALLGPVEPGQQVLSFGGMYSNHIVALAYLCAERGLPCTGFIRDTRRGEQEPLSQSLQRAQQAGMQLHFLSRSDYRRRHDPQFCAELCSQVAGSSGHEVLCVPEGGSSLAGVAACAGILDCIPAASYDTLALACGTGGTLAGLAAAMPETAQLLGIPVLAAEKFMRRDIDRWLAQLAPNRRKHCDIHLDFAHYGEGYAASSPALERFIEALAPQLPLEPCYSGKLFYALNTKIAAGEFAPGSRITALHTGGLQVLGH